MEVIDIHFQQNLALRKIVQNFPPIPKEQFEQWLKTSICHDWEYKWQYLKTLNIDHYLRMYAQLPALVIGKHPESGSAEYQLFQKYQERYLASSIWLKQLLDYGAPNYKEIYDSETMNLYRHDANTSMAQLDLCRAIVRHPKYALDDVFGTPIYLWFWLQVASCLRYFKNTGLTVAIAIQDVQSKKEVHSQWGKLINYYKEHENYCEGEEIVPTVVCKSVPEYLMNLPAILPTMATTLQKVKPDSMLSSALKNYLSATAATRAFTKGCSEVQVAYIYESQSLDTKKELFISGSKNKRPKR